MPEDVAAQLLRSARIVVGAAFFLILPYALLDHEPFVLRAIPRLLYTAWLSAVLLAVWLLVGSAGALCQRATAAGSLARRAWTVGGPFVRLCLIALMGMEVLGYRVGSGYLTERVLRTLGAIVILSALYHLLVATIGRVARVVRKKMVRVGDADAAVDAHDAVTEQLTRVVAGLLVAVAVGLLLYSWDAYNVLRGLMVNVHLLETADAWITLWDAARAVFWVVAAHFVVANLAAVSESAAMSDPDSGKRYVYVALSRYVILLVAYASALVLLQIPWDKVAWLLTALSVGIGFGLQEIVANFISGLILLIERPVRVGDTISVGETPGTVKRISIRATVVEAWDRKSIVIPNKSLITQNVTNWTHENSIMRRELEFTVAYGADLTEVLKVADAIVTGHPKVLRVPERMIRVQGFGDAGIDVKIFFFCLMSDAYLATSQIYETVYKEFGERGIEIPFPRQDLRVIDEPDEPDQPDEGTASTGQGD